MSTYFIKTETGQEGPFTAAELISKGITPDTAILKEGTEEWTTAGAIDELKSLLAVPETPAPAENMATEATTPVAAEKTDESKAPVTTASADASGESTAKKAAVAASSAATAVPVAKAGKKAGSAVIGWLLSFAAIAGTGYYVYQDIEKNKNPSEAAGTVLQTEPEATGDQTVTGNTDTTIAVTEMSPEDTSTAPTETVAENVAPVAVTTTPAKDPAAVKKAEEDRKKLLAAQAKKKEDEKKRLQAEAQKKEAAAAAVRETALRNNWARYVTVGSYKIEGDDKVKPFTIPVNNGYSVPLDKVTLRVDYLKKTKQVASETLVLTNLGANSTQTVQATGNKKGHTANVYIVGINSSRLHFCYPVHNGNPADPFYCK